MQIDGKLKADLVSQILDGESKETQITIQPPSETKPSVETQSIKLSKLKDEFIDEKDGTVGDKLLSEYNSVFEELIEVVGDLPVKTITKDIVISYINIQKKLPINRNKNPKYRGLTVEEILNLKNV